MKNRSFARFARACSIFVHFLLVLVQSTTRNELFCSCVNDLITCQQTSIQLLLLISKPFTQFNCRIVSIYCSANELESPRNDCRNTKLHFQMTFFSLSLKPSLLKLPVDRMRSTEAHKGHPFPSNLTTYYTK